MDLMVFLLVDDFPKPPIATAKKAECAFCSFHVWVSPEMIEPVVEGEVLPVCTHCAEGAFSTSDAEMAIHPNQRARLAAAGALGFAQKIADSFNRERERKRG